MPNYQDKKQQLAAQMCATKESVRLQKPTSNLFRARQSDSSATLKAAEFNQVLSVDSARQLVEVEGMTTYDSLSKACLAKECMPKVVPQLKSITIGGAVSGIGIESTSFRHGLPHESIQEMDILTAAGDVLTCRADNEHSDLFFGIANSYGTLGYILRLIAETQPVKPYVKLTHQKFINHQSFFDAIEESCHGNADFVDGSVFDESTLILTEGRMTDTAPYSSDYTWLKIYYRSLLELEEDYLSIYDYLWRWDTDWFWCSKNLYVQNLPTRFLLGRKHLNSSTYQKVMRWNTRTGVTRKLNTILRRQTESVIQDVDIPIENAAAFLQFFQREIGINPIWVCPIGGHKTKHHYPLYPLNGEGLFINFGFWDVVTNRLDYPSGHFNKLIENKVTELGGIKSLYSDSYYEASSFWSIYDGDRYQALKNKYDPEHRLKDLYQKCVLRQ